MAKTVVDIKGFRRAEVDTPAYAPSLSRSSSSALLLGATGAVGKRLLAELLASDQWTRVGEYGRRVTTPPPSMSGSAPPKLEQKVIDFDDLAKSDLKSGGWDVVFVTLGTTRGNAGSAAQFEKIDREYVVRACEAAKSDDPGHEQRVVYLSSAGANLTSPFLYLRSKGLTEVALACLGYADTIVFRPGIFKGSNRPTTRIDESVLGALTGIVARFCPGIEIEVSLLAKSMTKAGVLGSANIPSEVGATEVDAGQGMDFTLFSNQAAASLGSW